MKENGLECPITHEELTDPVIDKHGHTFEKSAILKWLQTKHTCPMSGEELKKLI